MANSDNVSRAIAEIFNRLTEHTKPGGRLAPLKFTEIPKTEIGGEKDLPEIRLAGVVNRETYRASAWAVPDVNLRLMLATKISEGYAASLNWAARVCDALETDTDGNPSSGLSGRLVKPISFVVESNSATGNAFLTAVTVALAPKPALRAARNTTT